MVFPALGGECDSDHVTRRGAARDGVYIDLARFAGGQNCRRRTGNGADAIAPGLLPRGQASALGEGARVDGGYDASGGVGGDLFHHRLCRKVGLDPLGGALEA